MSEKQNDIDLLQTLQKENANLEAKIKELTEQLRECGGKYWDKVNELKEKDQRIQLAEAKLEAECIRHKNTEAKVKELEKENNNLKFNIIEYMKKENLKLEALLIEACETMATHDLDWIEDFLNKPEIKKLLEGIKSV